MRTSHQIDLLLASMFFHPVYAGPAVRFHRYAPGLRARDIRMRVFAGTPYNGATEGTEAVGNPPEDTLRNGALLPVEYVDCIPVQRVQVPQGNKLRENLTYIHALFDYCRQPANRPDLIQFLSLSLWSVPWLLPLRRLRIPLVFTHTMLGKMSARVWKRSLQRLYWPPLFQLMDCVVVSSGVMRDELRDIGVTTRIEVIPNGVDLNRFQPVASPRVRNTLRRQLGLNPTSELILFVGPILPRKGVDVLVEAWSLLGRERQRAHLVLVGPRYDETLQGLSGAGFQARIKAIVASSGAEGRVIFTGPVNNVEAYYQAADVFVFPSRREGMPNVVPEAMACGLPCLVAPFVGLSKEFGKAGCEYLLVERTPDALSVAIQNVLASEDERAEIGRRARRWVEEHLDVESSLDRYAALYRDLASRSCN